MFDATVKTWLDDVESWQTVLTDADLTVTLDTGDVDNVATQAAINFSRNAHYLPTCLQIWRQILLGWLRDRTLIPMRLKHGDFCA